MEFSRQGLEWVAISFPRGSSHPKDWTQVSHIAGRRFTVWATREALWVTWLNPSTMNPGGLEWVLGGRNSWNLGTDPLQAVHGQREFPSWEQKWPVCAWYSGRKIVKNLPALRETWLQSLGWEDPLEKGMATHFSILTWRIPMDRGAWLTTVHGITESQTQLNGFHFSLSLWKELSVYFLVGLDFLCVSLIH